MAMHTDGEHLTAREALDARFEVDMHAGTRANWRAAGGGFLSPRVTTPPILYTHVCAWADWAASRAINSVKNVRIAVPRAS